MEGLGACSLRPANKSVEVMLDVLVLTESPETPAEWRMQDPAAAAAAELGAVGDGGGRGECRSHPAVVTVMLLLLRAYEHGTTSVLMTTAGVTHESR